MKISELKTNSKVTNLVVVISSLDEPIETDDGKVLQEGLLEDDTGQVKITLWSEHANKFQIGHKILISSAWCKTFQNELQITTGHHGKIRKVPPEKPA